jgi:hypothetical protein
MKRAPVSLAVLLFLCYALFRIAHFYPRWEKSGTEATLSWDVFGYYLYLPAYFIYDDLWGLEFRDSVFQQYQPAADFHHAVPQPQGSMVMKYPIGMAVAYLPWFAAGHALAGWQGAPQDGFSEPYQWAVLMGCIVYACLGLWVLRKVLLRFFSDTATALALAIIVLATNYLNHVSFDGAMAHSTLFSLFACLFWLTIEWHARPRRWIAACIGLVIGFCTIIRPTELLISLVPLLWGVHSRGTLLDKFRLLRSRPWDLALLVLSAALVGLIQMAYWKKYSGHWLYYSYEEFGFDWLRPHLLDGLFSYRKGWLVYTPVMLLALAGFVPLFRRWRAQFWAIAVFFAINLYVILSWEVWWYGGSFGMRPLVQSYALLALPLAAFLTVALERRRWLWGVIPFVILCTDLNLVMTWQAHDPEGGWHPESMTKAYFWKIFGSTNAKKADKKFLDVRHELRSTDGMTVRELYRNDFETDTAASRSERHARSGRFSCLLDGSHAYSPGYEAAIADLNPRKKSWVRVQANVFYTDYEWNEWKLAQLSCVFLRGEQVIKQTTCRIQRTTDPWRWHLLSYEMKVPPDLRPDDRLKIYVWNAGSDKEVFIDDLQAFLIEPQP